MNTKIKWKKLDIIIIKNKMTNTMQERFDELRNNVCECRHNGSTYSDIYCSGCATDCSKCVKNVFKSFIQSEIDLAVANREKEIVGEIRQKTLESWYEALTLSINKDGGVSPDVNLDLMGKILFKKITK